MARAPRSKAVEDLLSGALSAANRIGRLAVLSGKRVLLVEDLPPEHKRIKAMLVAIGGDGMDLSTARTSSAALDICLDQAGRFDLVLLNFRLGQRDNGLELLGDLRRAGLPVFARSVLYSVAMNRQLAQRARVAGFDAMLHVDEMDSLSLTDLLTELMH